MNTTLNPRSLRTAAYTLGAHSGRTARSLAEAPAATPVVSASLRIPASPENWAYLRNLREAELAAWNEALPLAEPKPAPVSTSALRRHVAESIGNGRAEGQLFTVVLGIATAAIGYGLWNSFGLVEHWSKFVQVIQQMLG